MLLKRIFFGAFSTLFFAQVLNAEVVDSKTAALATTGKTKGYWSAGKVAWHREYNGGLRKRYEWIVDHFFPDAKSANSLRSKYEILSYKNERALDVLARDIEELENLPVEDREAIIADLTQESSIEVENAIWYFFAYGTKVIREDSKQIIDEMRYFREKYVDELRSFWGIEKPDSDSDVDVESDND